VRRLADWLIPAENPSGVVYGVMVIGALLAAESGRRETYLDTVGSAVLAAGVYWLAHAYARVLGQRLAEAERLTLDALVRALGHDWALIRGAAIPLLVLLIAWALGASQGVALSAGVWSAVASLIGFELIAGIRSQATPRELVIEVGVGITMGIAILALKSLH
jgi:hypothetical protein